jgi:hypothetical protein
MLNRNEVYIRDPFVVPDYESGNSGEKGRQG